MNECTQVPGYPPPQLWEMQVRTQQVQTRRAGRQDTWGGSGRHTRTTQRSHCCCSTTRTHTPTSTHAHKKQGSCLSDRDATAASILLFPIVDTSLCFGRLPDQTHSGLTDCTSPTTWQQVQQRPANSVPLTTRRHLYIVPRYFCCQTWSLEYYFARIPLPDQEPTSMYVPHPQPRPLPHSHTHPPCHITI